MKKTRKIISNWLSKRFNHGDKMIVIEGKMQVGIYEIEKIGGEWTFFSALPPQQILYNKYYTIWGLINKDLKYKRIKIK